MTAVTGYNDLMPTAGTLTATNTTIPEVDLLRTVQTDQSALFVVDVSGVVRIVATWAEAVNPSSFTLHHTRGIPAGATWEIERHSDPAALPGDLIDTSGALPVHAAYTAPGKLRPADDVDQSVFTFLNRRDGYVETNDAPNTRAVVITITAPEGSTFTVGMVSAVETSALTSTAVDGRSGGGGVTQGSRPLPAHGGGVASADEENPEVMTFNLEQMETDDRNTFEHAIGQVGGHWPIFFQPYAFRQGPPACKQSEGGMVRIESVSKPQATRPQQGTAQDLYKVAALVVTPWV